MGTKYATILVGGVVQTYADGSPSDDGSTTEANRVKYSTITTDLTAPLHSAIINMDTKLLAHVDEGPTPETTYTTLAADHNSVIEATGTNTVTLLAPSGNAGYQVTVKNAGAGVITVDVSGGANVDGAASVTLAAGAGRKFYVNSGGTAYYSASGDRTSEVGIKFDSNDILLIQTSNDAAPDGWTKLTSGAYSDTAVRVVTSPGAGRTSQSNFSTVFGITSTDGTTLTAQQSGLRDHTHTETIYGQDGVSSKLRSSNGVSSPTSWTSGATSAGEKPANQAHSHAIDLRVNYCEMMAIQKD